MKYICFDKKI